MVRKRLVVGIGNSLQGPDAFGPAVVARLRARHDLPGALDLVDAGTDLLGCIDRFAAFDEVLLVDAVLDGGTGGVRIVEEATFSVWSGESPTSHDFSAVLVVRLFRKLYADATTLVLLVGLDVARVGSNAALPDSAVQAGVDAIVMHLARE